MHYFQLESYQFRGYFQTIRRQWKKTILPCAALFLTLLALVSAIDALYRLLRMRGISVALASFPGGNEAGSALVNWALFAFTSVLLPCACAVAGGILLRLKSLREKEKKKFVLTARMKRLYAVHGILLCGLLALTYAGICRRIDLSGSLRAVFDHTAAAAVLALPGALVFLLLPLLLPLSALLALPVERLIFHLYFHDAEKKLLENPRLIRIGITGSYGKTSTKFILAEILSQKYNVLATPASFNTPMGVTRIIRERLSPAHQVFIGEMGARHVGEIRELCRLVHPAIGILTTVGPRHLDTFRTLVRI